MPADGRGDTTGAPTDGDLSPGQHLRAEIERLGLDQVAVSQATGVSRQSINNIVNDRHPISRAMAGKLARLTGHSSDYWLRAAFPRQRISARIESATSFTRALGVLVDHQIISAVRDGIISVDPFEETNVRPASLELTLDDFVLTAQGKKIDISDGESFLLKRGLTASVSTKEWLEFPKNYLGRVGTTTALARLGIVTSHGFQVDPGFKGNLQFWIFNAGGEDFALRGGEPIISVEIMTLDA